MIVWVSGAMDLSFSSLLWTSCQVESSSTNNSA